VEVLLSNPERAAAITRLAKPELLPGGFEPEERLVIGGIGWEGHLALDEELGHDRSGPRFYYLDGDLEIMSTSDEHERIKKWIGSCLDIFFQEKELRNMPRGQATMRLTERTGAEPDESWCIGEEKRYPDIVLEIALTSGGLPKLEIYQRFGIPEVWIWRRGHLEIHWLRADGTGYDRAAESHLLPALPVSALEAAVAERDWLTATRAFRACLR
jgi:Uma2 family endonuclease